MSIERLIAVGDIHGDLDGLSEILEHAGVIDRRGQWSGGRTVLVQTGDVIDRGDRSVECVRILRHLQDQAPRSGGAVIRLCGNHELLLIQGNFQYADFAGREKLRKEFLSEVARGELTAAYTDKRWLFTHAGLRSKVRNHLLDEILKRRPGWDRDDIDLQALCGQINDVFARSVASGDFASHVIFNIDECRGGSDEYGGLFWGDYAPLAGSLGASKIPQVFGHTPSLEHHIRHTSGFKLINIDVGISKVFGEGRAFLSIDGGERIVAHEKGHEKIWVPTELGAVQQ